MWLPLYLFSDDILKQTVYLSKHASIEHHPLSKRIFLHQTRHFVLEHLLSFVCVTFFLSLYVFYSLRSQI